MSVFGCLVKSQPLCGVHLESLVHRGRNLIKTTKEMEVGSAGVVVRIQKASPGGLPNFGATRIRGGHPPEVGHGHHRRVGRPANEVTFTVSQDSQEVLDVAWLNQLEGEDEGSTFVVEEDIVVVAHVEEGVGVEEVLDRAEGIKGRGQAVDQLEGDIELRRAAMVVGGHVAMGRVRDEGAPITVEEAGIVVVEPVTAVTPIEERHTTEGPCEARVARELVKGVEVLVVLERHLPIITTTVPPSKGKTKAVDGVEGHTPGKAVGVTEA